MTQIGWAENRRGRNLEVSVPATCPKSELEHSTDLHLFRREIRREDLPRIGSIYSFSLLLAGLLPKQHLSSFLRLNRHFLPRPKSLDPILAACKFVSGEKTHHLKSLAYSAHMICLDILFWSPIAHYWLMHIVYYPNYYSLRLNGHYHYRYSSKYLKYHLKYHLNDPITKANAKAKIMRRPRCTLEKILPMCSKILK